MQSLLYWFHWGFHGGLGTRAEIPSEREIEPASAAGSGSGCIGMQSLLYWFHWGFHGGLGTRAEIPSDK